MFNFIIYEDEERFRDKYFSVIENFIGNSNIAYEIIEIPKYTEEAKKRIDNLTGNNIFILDIEVPGKSGFDLAREIRRKGDWTSQIIIVSSHEDLKNFDYQSSMLMLAFITKFYNVDKELKKALNMAYKILTTNNTIKYQKGTKVFSIPVDDILYFEKKQEEVHTKIITKDKEYITDKTLIQWEKELNDPRFVRTHRNYIVNTYNIRKFDFDRDEIKFDNNKAALLSRTYKKNLKNTTGFFEEQI